MQTLSQQQQLLQKLTPQQVQYLKLLQLPILALEQRIKEELEMNPLLEEEIELSQEREEERMEGESVTETVEAEKQESSTNEDGYTFEDFMNDDLSGYKANYSQRATEDREEFPMPAEVSLYHSIINQIHFL